MLFHAFMNNRLFYNLKSCEHEFVATPERLLELISLKSTDISGVCLLIGKHFTLFINAIIPGHGFGCI